VRSPGSVPSPPRPVRSVLDRPVWHSLVGRHASLGRHFVSADGTVMAARYLPDVSPFAAVADVGDPAGWAALATLVGPGGRAVVTFPVDATDGVTPWPPADWTVVMDLSGVQMVARDMQPAVDPAALSLGPADVTEMLDLVARTRPGPFATRTVELGGYVGFRDQPDGDGRSPRSGPADAARLVAMAGRRFAPDGFSEISAVCTDADWRGRGLGSRLVRTVAAGIVAEGEVPFLHASATNPAIALYRELGMVVRIPVRFVALEWAG